METGDDRIKAFSEFLLDGIRQFPDKQIRIEIRLVSEAIDADPFAFRNSRNWIAATMRSREDDRQSPVSTLTRAAGCCAATGGQRR